MYVCGRMCVYMHVQGYVCARGCALRGIMIYFGEKIEANLFIIQEMFFGCLLDANFSARHWCSRIA